MQSVAVCSCSLLSSAVTSACEKATCLHFTVTNVQEPYLLEPALSSRCFLSPRGKRRVLLTGGVSATRAPDPASTPSSTLSGGVDANKRPAADDPCCRYRQDPADLAAPVVGSTGDNRHGSALSGINKTAAGDIDVNRNGLGGQRNGLDGTRNDSTSRVGNAGPDSSSRMIVAWRGNRWREAAAAVETGTASTSFSGKGSGNESGRNLWLWACLAATAGAQVVRFFSQGLFQLPGQVRDMMHV